MLETNQIRIRDPIILTTVETKTYYLYVTRIKMDGKVKGQGNYVSLELLTSKY